MDNRLSNTGSCEPLVSIVFIIKISIWSILTLIGSEIGEDYKELALTSYVCVNFKSNV
jgi:hypothetical protein